MTTGARSSKSTTEIGNSLEDAVAAFIRNDIESGAYGIPSLCRVRQKERYFSRDREAGIVVDVSIEIFHPGAAVRSLLWYVECKNEGRPAEIGDVETLYARMDQIAGGATKGLLVSRAGFQRSVIQYAQSKGIALMRWAEGNFTWELRRERGGSRRHITQARERIARALAAEPLEAGMTPTAIMTPNGGYTASLRALLLDEPDALPLPSSEQLQPAVPFLTGEELEARADALLVGIGYQGGRVSVDSLLERLCEQRGLVVREEPRAVSGHHSDVLAALTFEPLELVLHPHDGLPPASRRFTVGHEVAHVALDHGEYLSAETVRESDASLVKEIDHLDVARMEVQANLLAAAVLLPRDALLDALGPLTQRLNLIDKGFGFLFVDLQPANQRAWSIVATTLTETFQVSQTVLRLRLRAMGLMTDSTRTTAPLDEILRGSRRS